MGLSGLTNQIAKNYRQELGGRVPLEKAKKASEARDSVSFGARNAEASFALPEKSFWKTVNHVAFGGKRVGFARQLGGVFIYPFALLKTAFHQIMGQTEGFKTLYPLRHENRSQIMARIETLNSEIKAPELRFPFSKEEVEAANLHKNHLLKIHDSLVGLKQLQVAQDWASTAAGLERFLSANGKNNSESCAHISSTHAIKLASGAPIKRLKLKEAQVSAVSSTPAGELDTVILPSVGYGKRFETEWADLSVAEIQKKIQAAEKHLVRQFGIAASPKLLTHPGMVEVNLLKAGNGAQALLFDVVGRQGHVTLAVNIKGRIYHIDNLDYKSAEVSSMWDWLCTKRIKKLWYAPLTERVHPGITGE